MGVRPHPTVPEDYELLAGLPRWCAARDAGLVGIPAQVCEGPALEQALESLEQLVRDPLHNPIALADTFQQLLELIPIATHDDLAMLSGLARNAVTHYLLLRGLPPPVCQWLAQGQLTLSHGKALCTRRLRADPESQVALAREALRQSWSSHELERRARGLGDLAKLEARGTKPASVPTAPAGDLVADPNIKQLAESLSQKTGMPVEIEHKANGTGRIIFQYFSLDETENLLRFIPLEQ